MKNVDYIIVGQGIAGTMVSFFALKANKKIWVINEDHPQTASKISAGLINPITGRKFVKTWMIDELLPFAEATYQELSEWLSMPFFYQKNIIRALKNHEQENNWMVRSSMEIYQAFMMDSLDLGNYKDNIHPVGGGYGEVTGGGQVRVAELLEAFANFLIKKEIYQNEPFDYSAIEAQENGVIYKDIKAEKIIFCEGIGIKNNPYFNQLPVIGNKGEVLIIHIPNFDAAKIMKQGVFFIPLGNEEFWVGSNYALEFDDELPSEKGRESLIYKIKKVLKLPFEIVKHQAAIRPTVLDRRPLIGVHPEFKHIAIFNGMGTKGASIAPYWANHLIEAFTTGQKIEKIADVKRCFM